MTKEALQIALLGIYGRIQNLDNPKDMWDNYFDDLCYAMHDIKKVVEYALEDVDDNKKKNIIEIVRKTL